MTPLGFEPRLTGPKPVGLSITLWGHTNILENRFLYTYDLYIMKFTVNF